MHFGSADVRYLESAARLAIPNRGHAMRRLSGSAFAMYNVANQGIATLTGLAKQTELARGNSP